MSHEVKNISITIAVPFEQAYERAYKPEFFPRWAAGMSSTADIEFTPKNPYGVLDHRVKLKEKPVIYVPLRMMANGDGTEVILTLFREEGMSDADFKRDEEHVKKDLASLKTVLES